MHKRETVAERKARLRPIKAKFRAIQERVAMNAPRTISMEELDDMIARGRAEHAAKKNGRTYQMVSFSADALKKAAQGYVSWAAVGSFSPRLLPGVRLVGVSRGGSAVHIHDDLELTRLMESPLPCCTEIGNVSRGLFKK